MSKKAQVLILSTIMLCVNGRDAAGGQQSTDDPRLDARVTISYQNAPAIDVLVALGRAGNFPTSLTTKPLLPVTVTLTNVKLRTALDAVCENAGCYWQLGRNEMAPPEYRDTLLLAIRTLDDPLPRLPGTVSIDLKNLPVSEAFRVFAAALKVTLVLETELPERRLSLNLDSVNATETLRRLCEVRVGNCAWSLDEKTRTLRVSPRK
jgi:hypothetical protein